MATARKLLQEALTLDESERATLALEILDSLAPPDVRDEGAWLEEVERRARRALSGHDGRHPGASPGVDVDDAIDRISRDLGL